MLVYAPMSENKLTKMYEEIDGKLIVLSEGIYLGGLNFHLFLDLPQESRIFMQYDWDQKYSQEFLGSKDFWDVKLPCYGVCDSIDQWKEYYKHLVDNKKVKAFVSFTEIRKEHQPEEGGWRWHKWGPYIGTHEIEYEYLYDEKDIESVFVYHVYVFPWD